MHFRSSGSRLFAETLGAGRDLVLLHPTPLDHAFWGPVARELDGRYRLVLPDLRGHGRSEAGEGILGMARFAGDIEELLKHLSIERALFAGCSIGGYVLYELWRRAPETIGALAFCCSKPQPDAASNRAKRQQTIEGIRLHGAAEFFDQTLDFLVTAGFRSREPAKTSALRRMMDSMSAEAAIAIQQGLMDRPDSVGTLPSISVPVLALAGSDDPASSPQEMQVIPQLLPTAEYHLLPGAGHFAPYEQPREVAGLLDEFFSRVEG
ncbi:MAG TPA: alpha/beta fold hydrolase [Acidobacteriaceae bacterium]|nr:alpha/beta fold hydrolase [Acidobacteriaceae bacterium]